jgi:hypothetical protein
MAAVQRSGRFRQQPAGCNPIVIGSERQSEPFIRHPKIAVVADSDRIGSYSPHFLRNHSDIDLLATVVGKAIVTEAVV